MSDRTAPALVGDNSRQPPPGGKASWRLRCEAHTPLLVRDVTAEDQHSHSAWRDDLADAIRAYGDAREEGHGSADALSVLEHLLDQADESQR